MANVDVKPKISSLSLPYIENMGAKGFGCDACLDTFLENTLHSSPPNGCNYIQFKACLIARVLLRGLWIVRTSPLLLLICRKFVD